MLTGICELHDATRVPRIGLVREPQNAALMESLTIFRFLAGVPFVKVASRVTLDPLQLVQVKLARAECLAEAGFPAEAASALAGVLSGGSTPKTTGDYAGRRCHASIFGGINRNIVINQKTVKHRRC